ncbi:DUF6397 family protein [Streptomyces chumphonensis]|uniref:DUF6397 family protein n=1 Tax=Streptomyces chumphonensis TaxID=1214925 RepID=UPI001CD1562F
MSVCVDRLDVPFRRLGRGAAPCEGRKAATSVSGEEAARELRLAPREFELAVELGEVRTVPPARPGGRRRVPRSEVLRLRVQPGFPEALHARLHLVGAGEGAARLGVTAARFTRLARAGCVGPVRLTVNRYRRPVWLYRTIELEQFATRQPGLLHGALPRTVRDVVAEGADWRPRWWRGRRVGQFLRQAEGPWSAAAVHGAVLSPEALEEAVPDPAERRLLSALRPPLVPGRSASPSLRAVAGEMFVARSPDEVRWHRLNLALELARARAAESGSPSAPVGAEEPLLDHRHQQPALAVVDPPPGQPAPAGRDG